MIRIRITEQNHSCVPNKISMCFSVSRSWMKKFCPLQSNIQSWILKVDSSLLIIVEEVPPTTRVMCDGASRGQGPDIWILKPKIVSTLTLLTANKTVTNDISLSQFWWYCFLELLRFNLQPSPFRTERWLIPLKRLKTFRMILLFRILDFLCLMMF